ncbi:MAG: 2-hydroxymuconate tautomerase family protein [Desulfomonilaceae bacterium]
MNDLRPSNSRPEGPTSPGYLILDAWGGTKEESMPYVNIRITREQTTAEQKAELIRGVTQLLVDVLGKDPQTAFVIIDEVDTDNWGVAGESVTARRQRLRK